MTDIEIGVLGETAYTSGKEWVCKNKTVMSYLNSISNRKLITGYTPDCAQSMLDLVQKANPKTKVVSIVNQPKYEKGEIY